jgi:hypothetical protein
MAQYGDRRSSATGTGGLPPRPVKGKAWRTFAFVALAVIAAVVALGLLGSTNDTSEAEQPAARAPITAPALKTGQSGRQIYVALNGVPTNPGTVDAPVDLATALSANTPAAPGDVILLRQGTYTGHFTSVLTGTEAAPIRVQQFPGERATLAGTELIDPVLTAGGSWTWFSGLEITMSTAAFDAIPANQPADLRQSGGIAVRGAHQAFTNMIIHDVPKGVDIAKSPGTLLAGNIIYHAGWRDSALGLGIRSSTENQDLFLLDNVVFNQGAAGIAISMTAADRLLLEGNVSFNNGISGEFFNRNLVIEGGVMTVAQNFTYYRPSRRGGENNFGYGGGCVRVEATGNYFAARQSYPVVLSKCDGILKGNTFIGSVDEAFAGRYPENTVIREDPTGLRSFVRPSRYHEDRVHIVVFNWDRYPAVNVDMAGSNLAPGTSYEIRDAQDFFGEPVSSGVYDGGRLNIPMTGRKAARPSRLEVTEHTAPEFAVFILTKLPVATTSKQNRSGTPPAK